MKGKAPKDASLVKKAGTAVAVSVHRQVRKNDDGNAAVEGANSLAEGSRGFTIWNSEVPEGGTGEKAGQVLIRQRKQRRLRQNLP